MTALHMYMHYPHTHVYQQRLLYSVTSERGGGVMDVLRVVSKEGLRAAISGIQDETL